MYSDHMKLYLSSHIDVCFIVKLISTLNDCEQLFLMSYRAIDDELFITFDDGRSALKAMELDNTKV